MYNNISFGASLIRKNNFTPANGDKKAFIALTLVRNYSEKQQDGSYRDVHSEFVNCNAFGKLAENIERSNFAPGTRLQATGRILGRTVPAYTNRTTGQTVPEHGEEVVILENLAPDLSMGNYIVTVTKADGSAIGQSTPPSNNQITENSFATVPSNSEVDNIFTSQNTTPSTNDSSTDDPFADLFN